MLYVYVITSQLIGRLFSPSQKAKKTNPSIPTVFSVRFGYTSPPRKILGCVYEASKEHVFHKGPLLDLDQFPLFKGGDPCEKHVLWKLHKHHLIFCVVDMYTQT